MRFDNSQGKGANKNLKIRKGVSINNSEIFVGIIFSWKAIVGTFVAPSVFFASRYSKETLVKYSDVIKSLDNKAKPNKIINIKLRKFLLNAKSYVNKEFTEEIIVNKTIKIYSDIFEKLEF